MVNRKISKFLKEIANYLEFKGENPFKVRAYREASKIVENLPFEIETQDDLKKLKNFSGIGDTIIKRIEEILKEGDSFYLSNLKKEYPLDLSELLSIRGLGIKKIRLFYEKLGIKNIDDLKEALYSGKLLSLPRIGEKVIKNIRKGIDFVEKNKGYPLPFALEIIKDLIHIMEGFSITYRITGELRRKKEFVKNFDFVILREDIKKEFLQIVKGEFIEKTPYYEKIIYAYGDIQGAFYITDIKFFWHILFITTGVSSHVDFVFNKYKEKTLSFWKMNFSNEKEIYSKIGLPVIPPIFREGRGEFSWYSLKNVISNSDIYGEFHVHSTWSDGVATIPEILDAAYKRGYEYIGISDHSASLMVAGGLSHEEVYKKKDEILRLRRENPHVYPLLGAEVDIGADGSLDYPDEILKEFDYVIAAIHTNFGKGVEENTKRIISALKNPYVIAFAHPTGRELGIRPGYEFDREEVFKKAAENGIFLEINGTPRRMDLDSYEIFRFKSFGLKFILSSDAHHLTALSNIDNSIIIANKAGLRKEDILNTYSLEDVRKIFKKIRKGKIKNL